MRRRRDDWARFGRLVRDRREELGLSQGAGNVSVSTWRKVEHAIDPPYRRSTLVAIAHALDWTPQSIDRVLQGGDPVGLRDTDPASPPEPERPGETWAERTSRLQVQFDGIAAELGRLRAKVEILEREKTERERRDRAGGQGRERPAG